MFSSASNACAAPLSSSISGLHSAFSACIRRNTHTAPSPSALEQHIQDDPLLTYLGTVQRDDGDLAAHFREDVLILACTASALVSGHGEENERGEEEGGRSRKKESVYRPLEAKERA